MVMGTSWHMGPQGFQHTLAKCLASCPVGGLSGMYQYAFSTAVRVVYWFGIFGWYSVGISWYLPNRYRRKTQSVHFGIIFWREPLFSSKGGSWPPFWGAQPPFWGKKGFPPNLKEFPANSLVLKIPTKILTDQYQYMVYQYRYRPSCQYRNGIQL
jgi:hypothetical protein